MVERFKIFDFWIFDFLAWASICLNVLQKVMRGVKYLTLVIMPITSFGQASIDVIDSIRSSTYTVYIVGPTEELIFQSDSTLELTPLSKATFGRNIHRRDRIVLTRDQAKHTDQVLEENYSKACVEYFIGTHNERLKHPNLYDTLELRANFNSQIKQIRKSTKASARNLSKNDRHLYGFRNEHGDTLVYIRFTPRYKLKYTKTKGTWESHPVNQLMPIVYNLSSGKLGAQPNR
jgi:hypothetical protein